MWTYEQPTGTLRDKNGKIVAHGYSGAPGAVNDHSKQEIAKVGPIPIGYYAIGEPFRSPLRGPYCLRLTAHVDNVMFGRDGFLCHGDRIGAPGTASEGCLILPRPIRQLIWESGDHLLHVALSWDTDAASTVVTA